MILVNELTKSFGDFVAVQDLSFDIKAGEVVGFLGPNGAGKSTTMKMLTGFLTPTKGTIKIGELDMKKARQKIQSQIGYLPEGAPAYGDMTPLQFLRFIASVRGLKGQDKKDRIDTVIEQVELHQVLNKSIDNLSKGFKRRVGLAQAIIHDPDILILDEPTDGLDPNQKHQVRELIKNISKDKIVIVSTHILEEVTAVCNRAMIISNGVKLFDGTPIELQKKSRYYKAVSLRMSYAADISGLAELPGVADMEVEPKTGTVTLFPENDAVILPAITDLIHRNKLPIDDLFVEQGRLDDVFREITEERVVS
ncbi:ABC transporter ATP-binding protein [Alteromonadaceae bacterium M269]|nr:ABC transporter ATP-binding protein [Alteromonadaceae bacterium M269]